MKKMTLLFPSSFFDSKKVDEDLEQEYAAALDTGYFNIILFSYDDWFNKNRVKLTVVPDRELSAVYRGWMMKPEQYTNFYNQLRSKNIRLITTPEMYERLHIFPKVYPLIAKDTARILKYPLHADIDIAQIQAVFNRFMVKDYVKSVKGTDVPAYFDKSVTQAEFDRWMDVFYKYRGDHLTGGICIKEYLDLKRYGTHTNEYRVFYIDHEIACVSRNSLQENYTSVPPTALIEKYRNLDSVFYTIDYAELEDGTWKVIEAGDGSVSGLSDRQDNVAFYRALYQCLRAFL